MRNVQFRLRKGKFSDRHAVILGAIPPLVHRCFYEKVGLCQGPKAPIPSSQLLLECPFPPPEQAPGDLRRPRRTGAEAGDVEGRPVERLLVVQRDP